MAVFLVLEKWLFFSHGNMAVFFSLFNNKTLMGYYLRGMDTFSREATLWKAFATYLKRHIIVISLSLLSQRLIPFQCRWPSLVDNYIYICRFMRSHVGLVWRFMLSYIGSVWRFMVSDVGAVWGSMLSDVGSVWRAMVSNVGSGDLWCLMWA